MRIKKLLPYLLSAILVVIAVATPVLAVDPVEQVCNEASGSPICEAQKGETSSVLGRTGLMTKVVQLFVYVAGVVSVIGLTVAGIQYSTSNGDPGSIQTAKNSAVYSVIGVVIAIFAQAIVLFVLNRL